MKKEEQQKNNEKISFFEGTEKTGEMIGFFNRVKRFFKKKVPAGELDFKVDKSLATKKASEAVDAASASKGKTIPKKESLNALAGNQFKESKTENRKKTNSQSKIVPDWSASDILSTNLIKGESTLIYHWNKKIYILLTNVFLVIFVVGLAYGGLLYWEKAGTAANEQLELRANDLKTRIENLKKETKEIDVFNKKIALAKNLLDNHVYWNNLFEFLENNILTNVYLENSFSGGLDGEYVIRAYTNDLKTMLDQVNYLRQEDKKDKILSVELSDIIAGDGVDSKDAGKIDSKYKVSFDLILKINKNIFYKK